MRPFISPRSFALVAAAMVGWLALSIPAAAALTDEERGLDIARESDALDSGWHDQRADMLMVLRNRQGEESIRAVRIRSLEVQGDGDKSLTLFDSPKDVKGAAFLTFTHATEPDDQWIYLPALKRVKRIASVNKSGPFMGSEFAYEDMTSQEVDKYAYKWLRDESVNGSDAMVVERLPNYEHSGYTRQIVWIDAEIYRPLKVEYYDRKAMLLKTLTVHDYRQYLDRYWRPDRMEMLNHQSGKSTVLEFSDYQFQTGLTKRDFDRNALKRAR